MLNHKCIAMGISSTSKHKRGSGVRSPRAAHTPTPDAGRIEAAFAFEDENLPANELRILLANDLFRMAHEEEEEAAQGGVATPPVSI